MKKVKFRRQSNWRNSNYCIFRIEVIYVLQDDDIEIKSPERHKTKRRRKKSEML